uniref:Uncharacterized protein n=1 Tax=Lygus hesperus TaxID=30085 RepID=A0A146L2D5_LYGHE
MNCIIWAVWLFSVTTCTGGVEENADIYKVGYKTKTGDVCEGELKKEGNATKSHKFMCHKENIAGRSIHAILEDDEPLFGPNEHAEDNILKLEKFQRLHLNKKTKKKKKLCWSFSYPLQTMFALMPPLHFPSHHLV